MSNTKHTPGPWTANDMHDDGLPELWVYDTRADQLIARVICETQTHEANARLIAAAPDLLEALHDALVQLECSPMVSGYSEVVKRARAALAKAKVQS